MHQELIAKLGAPLGELWNLTELAAEAAPPANGTASRRQTTPPDRRGRLTSQRHRHPLRQVEQVAPQPGRARPGGQLLRTKKERGGTTSRMGATGRGSTNCGRASGDDTTRGR